MKYRHSYHAGNFADVHKHVTLLALLDALQRKDKGFLYVDTHAGRGSYDLSTPGPEAAAGVVRFLRAPVGAPELLEYRHLLTAWRERPGQRHVLPGSPLVALARLRAQDRAVLVETNGAEEHALREAIQAQPGTRISPVATAPATTAPATTAPATTAAATTATTTIAATATATATAAATVATPSRATARVVRGDGFSQLRALLPPPQRRALCLLDPPYEQAEDFERVARALADAATRFPTGVYAAWYPIKEQQQTERWLTHCAARVAAPLTCCELWLYPRDSRVALNGSGMLIANAPWQVAERAQVWLPQLLDTLDPQRGAGTRVQQLPRSDT